MPNFYAVRSKCIGAKTAHKMMVKLTPEGVEPLPFLIKFKGFFCQEYVQYKVVLYRLLFLLLKRWNEFISNRWTANSTEL